MQKSSARVDKPALFAAALIVAIGGLIYELLLGTTASYLFGDSITSFSIGIGTMLFGMGIGSLLAGRLIKNSAVNFVRNELVLGLLGGNAVFLLFVGFSVTKLYWLIYITLSVGIGIAIGLEIPLMVSMAKQHSSKDNVQLLSKILALDYLGALVASILFPFVLLPYVGLLRTAYLVALLNVLIAAYILRRLSLTSRVSNRLKLLTVGVCLALVGCFLYASKIEQKLNTTLYQDPVVHYKFSPYQKIVLTKYKDDVRLYLNDQLQFSSQDEARYHETLAHSAATTTPRLGRVLILGGGDGLLAREFAKYSLVKEITIVDLDKDVTSLAKDNDLLRVLNENIFEDQRVNVINQDAFTYVLNTQEEYDIIAADLVDPSNEKIAKFYTTEFYNHVRQKLSERGVFVTQATSTYFTPHAFSIIQNTMETAFTGPRFIVTPLSVNVPSFGEWGILIARKADSRLFDEQLLPADLRYLNQLTRQSLIINAERLEKSTDAISTLLNPKVYMHYQQDMQQWRY